MLEPGLLMAARAVVTTFMGPIRLGNAQSVTLGTWSPSLGRNGARRRLADERDSGGMEALERRERSGSRCRMSQCLLHCLSSVFTPIINLHSHVVNS
jgi:hypothetical protein